MMPLQSRANAALGHELGDPFAAAAVSFGSGLGILLLAAALIPATRAGALAILPALRERRIPWYFMLAGLVGAYFVACQSLSVPMTGIALFTVATVTGQTASGLLVDHWGLGPAGRKAITLARVLGVVLMLLAVAVTVSGKATTGASSSLLWLLLPLSAGFLMSFQQAANGRSARAYGSPIAATLVNFATGFLGLVILWWARNLGHGFPALHGEWWMFIGGACGCVFIAVNAWLLKHLGVLATAMGMIGGQLLGSLALDLVFPVAGSHVGWTTVAGILLTGGAMGVMNIRRRRR